MPIYEYRCGNCAHELEALQKISEPALSLCPACNHESLVKQVTAAGFQLKGSGWYQTDFRNGSGGSKPANSEAKPDAAKPEAAKTDAPAATSASTETKSASAGGCGASCACH